MFIRNIINAFPFSKLRFYQPKYTMVSNMSKAVADILVLTLLIKIKVKKQFECKYVIEFRRRNIQNGESLNK